MTRTIRYQGAIIQDDCVLLIRFRDPASEHTYWMIPGGGQEPDESEEACVQREMREETSLHVIVERLLLEEDEVAAGSIYQRKKTYLCRVESGIPSPGHEPEFPMPSGYGIIDARWFHLAQPETWGDDVYQDAITHPLLLRIQQALGYTSGTAPS